MPVEYTLWETIGESLQEHYDRQYITPEEFLDTSCPLTAFVATDGLEEFFGTKVLNICIVDHPFGWRKNDDGELEDHWDEDIQPQVDVQIARHIETYPKYAKYQTLVWIDMNYAKEQENRDSESRAREMLAAVGSRMSEICDQLADYGWTFMGNIDDAPEWNFFQQYIDEFYGIAES